MIGVGVLKYKNKIMLKASSIFRSHSRHFLPFVEAREYVRSLGLKSKSEWNEFSKLSERSDKQLKFSLGTTWNLKVRK